MSFQPNTSNWYFQVVYVTRYRHHEEVTWKTLKNRIKNVIQGNSSNYDYKGYSNYIDYSRLNYLYFIYTNLSIEHYNELLILNINNI